MASDSSSAYVCTTLSKSRSMLANLITTAPLYLDTETTGLSPRRNKLVAIQLHQEHLPFPIILDWRRKPAGENAFLASHLSGLLSRMPLIVGHNIKFDVNFLAANGITVGKLWDTKVAEQVLVGMGAQEGASFRLQDVTFKYLGLKMSKEERTWFYKPAPLDERPAEWEADFPEDEVRYMALDVTTLPVIYQKQLEQFEASPKLHRVFKLEMRCLPAYAEMEQAGIRIDMQGWRSFIAEKAQEAAGLEGELLEEVALPILAARLAEYDQQRAKLDEWVEHYDLEVARLRTDWELASKYPESDTPGWGEYKQSWMAVWREAHERPPTPKQDTTLPNVNSQDQMVGALQTLGIELPTKRNDAGNWVPTLDSKQLAPLEDDYPILQLLSRQRKAVKFVDAFGDNLLEMAEAEDDQYGRLYPTINSIGAATGRNSMNAPNFQQVPSKGDGVRLRKLVVPAPGCRLVVCDFSNIEWRIMAAVTGDETAIGWLAAGLDIHCEVARRIWNLPAEMTKEEMEDKEHGPVPGWSYRDLGKTVNYGLLYGMTEKRLARVARTDIETAKAILAGYFDALPGVRGWLDTYGKQVLKALRSETLLGRVRVYQEATTKWERLRVMRQGCNGVIQGTSADITKGAVALYHEAPRHGHLIAVVHDEMVLEVPTRHAETEARLLEDKMDAAQVSLLCPRLPREALPRPQAKVAEYWSH